MADRVKYFLLGVLFLVVAGVIAYDRWNSAGEPQEVADRSAGDTGEDFDFTSLKVDPDASSPRALPEPQPNRTEPVPGPFETERRPVVDVPPAPPTPAPTPRPEPKPAPPPAPEVSKTHVIKKGETLEKIALHYYGTRDGIQWIAEANRLDNANRIFANQKLVIPARKEIAKGATKPAPAEKSDGKIPSRYTVKDGDGNLYAICRRFYGSEGQGARVSRVMEMNHLWSADVKAGTALILPSR